MGWRRLTRLRVPTHPQRHGFEAGPGLNATDLRRQGSLDAAPQRSHNAECQTAFERNSPTLGGPAIHWRCMILALAVAAPAWLSTPSASSGEAASLYEWTDAAGVVRYTPQLERIPPAALPGVRVLRRDPFSGAIAAFRWGKEEPLAPAAPLAEIAASAPPRDRARLELPAQTRATPAEPPRAGERVLVMELAQPAGKPAAGESGPHL